MNRTSPRRLLSVALLGLAMGVAACAYQPGSKSGDAAVDARNSDLQTNQRVKSLQQAWDEAKQDPARLKDAREASKDLLFKWSAPYPLRKRALALLLTDESAEGMADTRHLLSLLLPFEGQWGMLQDMCEAVSARAADAAWKKVTPSLVRSYARRVPTPPDEQRPDRAAIVALHPGEDLIAVVFEVYVRPVESGAPTRPDDFPQRSRDAAWELLGRIDPDGSHRAALAAKENSSDPAIRDINRCARELQVIPVTASELAWLHRLMDDSDKRNAEWWAQTSGAVRTLGSEQKTGLQMRHLEVVRWAADNRPEWIGSSRERLLSEVHARLDGRRIWLKSQELPSGMTISKERVKDWEGQGGLAWGDLLSILVLDDAVHERGMVLELFKQAAQDRADTSTEYGGVIWAAGEGGVAPASDSRFAIRGYQPRVTQRGDDRKFTAPEEMFTDSARCLAHYHFHVQTANNREYAGPGMGDLDLAATHGRNFLVFTSVKEGVMDVDYYQRNGAVIDLGEIAVGR